jgi:hypothetical protein
VQVELFCVVGGCGLSDIFTNDNEGSDVPTTESYLYDSIDKAILAVPSIMDQDSPFGNDWRNGLEEMGVEDEEDYLCFEYNPNIGTDGGTVLSNGDAEDSCKVEIFIKRLMVNPVI